MPFEFATAGRVVFGPGTLPQAVAAARDFGRSALIITGRTSARVEPFLDALRAAGLNAVPFSIQSEPSTDDITAGVSLARAAGAEVVIGFGGGAALDSAKAIAAMLTNPGELLDYLEVVGRAQPLPRDPAPCIAIPTTAGTGSEATRNAVLLAPTQKVKVSLRSPRMLPRLAVVDPELTCSLSRPLTATTGLDALTQLLEPYVSPRANPITDALCVDGLRRAAVALPRAVADGRDLAARSDMALASLFGGMALANAGLGAVHGLAGPLGGMYPQAPHGALCAALLPHVMAANLAALRARLPGSPAVARFGEVARLLTGDPHADADRGVAWVRSLTVSLAVGPLRQLGVQTADFPAIAAAAAKSSSLKGNPLPLSLEDLTAILAAAW